MTNDIFLLEKAGYFCSKFMPMSFPWGHQKRYNDYTSYIRTFFRGGVQKLSVNAGFTCPNRDGTKGRGGCTYCNNDSFRPEYCLPAKSVHEQLEEGKAFFGPKRNPQQYLAYFQSFSNTYASVEKLQRLYYEALRTPQIAGIVIATRPDCIDKEKLDLLSHLAEKFYVGLEFGVETCCNATLRLINRGHSFEDSVKAIDLAANRGIHVGAHLILGLPGETRVLILDHATQLSKLPLETLKIHQLQIVKHTQMAYQFHKQPGNFHLYSADEYIDLIVEFLERLNPAIVVERFASQSPPEILIAPKWGLKNFEISRRVEKRLELLNTYQGKHYF